MAASLFSSPPSRAYHRDNNFFTIQTDLITVTPATVHLDFFGTGPDLGEQFRIQWAGNDITFTVEADTNSTATAIPLKDVGETLAQYVDRCFEAFRQNEGLTADFIIARGGTVGSAERVSFIQRVPGLLDITTDNGWDIGAVNKVTDDVTDGTASSSVENLRAYVQVWLAADDPNADTRVVSLHAPYDNSNTQAIFTLKDIFELRPALPATSSITETAPATWHNGIGYGAFERYYLRYADKYGIPAVSEALLKSSNYYMLHGGRPGDALTTIYPDAPIRLLHTYQTADGAPILKPVHFSQPDWVYLFTLSALSGCYINLEITWSEGSVTVEDVVSLYFDMEQNKVYWLASGPYQHNVDDWVPPEAGAKPVSYNWRLYGDAGDGAELLISIPYKIVYEPWAFFLVMDNGSGGCESVLMNGKTTWKYNAERDVARRPRWVDYNVAAGELLDFAQEGQQEFQVNTGYFEEGYIEHLRQLLLGTLWIIDVHNARFLRVLCDTKSIEVRKDDQQLVNLSFTLRAAWLDTNWHL